MTSVAHLYFILTEAFTQVLGQIQHVKITLCTEGCWQNWFSPQSALVSHGGPL